MTDIGVWKRDYQREINKTSSELVHWHVAIEWCEIERLGALPPNILQATNFVSIFYQKIILFFAREKFIVKFPFLIPSKYKQIQI